MIDRQTDRQGLLSWYPERQTGRQTDRQADGQAGRQQMDRQADTLLMLLSSYRTVFCFFSTAKTTPFFAIEEKQPVL